MIHKIIYYISILSFCFFTFLLIQMMPLIFHAKWQGMVFLLGAFSILLLELVFLIERKEFIQASWTYNLMIVAATMYLSIVYYRIYSVHPTTISFYYDIDMNYCQKNYLVLTLVFIFIMIHLYFLKKEKK